MKADSFFEDQRERPVLKLLFALVMSLMVPAGVLAQEGGGGETVVVNIDGVVYEMADEASRVILRVESGDRFEVLAVEGRWVKIQLARGSGWILESVVRGLTQTPTLSGLGQDSVERVTVVDEFADLRQGPGEAYLGIRRVFRGESFVVSTRSEDGTWVELRVDGDKAWIRADQTMSGGEVDVETKREVRWEKPGLEDAEDETASADDPSSFSGLELELEVGASVEMVSQRFNSDSPSNIFLQLYEVETTTVGALVEAQAFFNDYLGVGLSYGFGVGAPLTVALKEGQQPQELNNQTHRLDASITGRFSFEAGWLGLTTGLGFHHLGIQPLQPDASSPPIFLNNTYTGLRIMAEGEVALGGVDIFGGGGVVLGAIDQGDFNSGE
jgi:SH3-like domain-containing protein